MATPLPRALTAMSLEVKAAAELCAPYSNVTVSLGLSSSCAQDTVLTATSLKVNGRNMAAAASAPPLLNVTVSLGLSSSCAQEIVLTATSLKVKAAAAAASAPP